MALQNSFEITADLKKTSYQKSLTVIQNDDITFVVIVKDDELDFPLTEVTSATLANVRLDKVAIVTPGTINGNEITFKLGTNETAVPGRVDATVQLYDAAGRVSTVTFNYKVIKDPTGSGFIPSQNEQTLIQVVLGDGPLIIQEAQTAGDYAQAQGDYVESKRELIDTFTGEQTNLQAQVNQLVVDGDSSPEAAQARVGSDATSYPTLKARLDAEQNSVTSQLAEKAKQTDLNSTNANVELKRDKSVKITNADLDVSADANKVKLVNLSDEVKQAMAGTTPINASVANGAVTREKLADSSYTRNMTKFFKPATTNLYDKTFNTPGYYHYQTGVFTNSADHKTTDYIPVLGGEQYIQKAQTYVTFYDVNKIFISGVFASSWTVPAGTGIAYMRCTVDNVNVENNIINKGVTLQPYTDYKVTDEKLLIKTVNLASDLLIPESNIAPVGFGKMEGFIRVSTNLFDKTKSIVGFPSLTTGVQNSNASYRTSDFIEVLPSTTYTHNGFSAAYKVFYDLNKTFISGINTAPPFTTPANAKYVKIGVAVPELGDLQTQINAFMLVEGNILPSQYIPYYFYKLDETKLAIPSPPPHLSNWKDKTWNALGDSITFGYRTTKTYWQYINEEKDFADIRNYGVSGSRIAYKSDRADEMSTRYGDMDNSADLVTVFGGTNDFSGSIPIGTMDDTTNTTFYGALRILIEGLINKYPSEPIVFITPLHRGGTPIEGLTENQANGAGHKLVDYVNAIKTICPNYSIPVYDLWSLGGMQPNIQAQHDLYFTIDGLHPNATGHEVMGRKIGTFLEML